MAGLDIFFDYGTPDAGLPLKRDDLYAAFVELREQYLSGMQSFAWSGGRSGRDDCFMLMRAMLRSSVRSTARTTARRRWQDPQRQDRAPRPGRAARLPRGRSPLMGKAARHRATQTARSAAAANRSTSLASSRLANPPQGRSYLGSMGFGGNVLAPYHAAAPHDPKIPRVAAIGPRALVKY